MNTTAGSYLPTTWNVGQTSPTDFMFTAVSVKNLTQLNITFMDGSRVSDYITVSYIEVYDIMNRYSLLGS